MSKTTHEIEQVSTISAHTLFALDYREECGELYYTNVEQLMKLREDLRDLNAAMTKVKSIVAPDVSSGGVAARALRSIRAGQAVMSGDVGPMLKLDRPGMNGRGANARLHRDIIDQEMHKAVVERYASACTGEKRLGAVANDVQAETGVRIHHVELIREKGLVVLWAEHDNPALLRQAEHVAQQHDGLPIGIAVEVRRFDRHAAARRQNEAMGAKLAAAAPDWAYHTAWVMAVGFLVNSANETSAPATIPQATVVLATKGLELYHRARLGGLLPEVAAASVGDANRQGWLSAMFAAYERGRPGPGGLTNGKMARPR